MRPRFSSGNAVSVRNIVAGTSTSSFSIVSHFPATKFCINWTTPQDSWGKWSRTRHIDANIKNMMSIWTGATSRINELHSQVSAESEKREVVTFKMFRRRRRWRPRNPGRDWGHVRWVSGIRELSNRGLVKIVSFRFIRAEQQSKTEKK
jgi:hypothetical protein